MNLDRFRALAPAALKKSIAQAIAYGPMDAGLRAIFPAGVPHYGNRIPARRRGQAASLFFGLYERAEIYMTRKLLPPGMDVVELGGSLGANTCLIARKSRRVVCVEADPGLAADLEATLSRNGLSNVSVVPKAIASGRSAATFSKGNTNLGGHLGSEGIEVPATSLTELLEEHGFGEYALVSDCEGAEVGILREEPHALARCRVALIEMGGAWDGQAYTPDQVEQMFLANGFRQTYRYGACAAFVRESEGR